MGLLEICFYVEDLSINILDEIFLLGSINIGFFRIGDIFLKWLKVKIDINFVDIDVLFGVFKGLKENVDVFVVGGLNLFFLKKNCGNCFLCVGDGNKEDLYRKIKGNVGFDLSGFDGLLEMVEFRKMDIIVFVFEFYECGEINDLDFRIIGLDFYIEGLNKGILMRLLEVFF